MHRPIKVGNIFLIVMSTATIGLFLAKIWLGHSNESINLVLPSNPHAFLLSTHSTAKSVQVSSKDQPASIQAEVSPETERKVSILHEIFETKNDNDPRLDTEFRNLSAEAKRALQHEYTLLKSEAKNERGTLVFLLGRNLSSKEDFDFLGSVLKEGPCLSLSNCEKADTDTDPHNNMGVQITKEYSQIMAIRALERYLKEHPGSPMALSALRAAAENSQNPLAKQMAKAIISPH